MLVDPKSASGWLKSPTNEIDRIENAVRNEAQVVCTTNSPLNVVILTLGSPLRNEKLYVYEINKRIKGEL